MARIQRVLIVDDLPHARRYLRVILEAAGMTCLEAESCEDALSHKFSLVDLVFTDLTMPGLGGLPLIERIQGGALGAPPPQIVVCSAMAGEPKVQDQIMGMGCAGSIAKPYLPVEVHELLLQLS